VRLWREKEYSTAEDLVAELCRELSVDFIKDIPIGDIRSGFGSEFVD
jgi:hypothetical protein